jgi:hypothetical protein
MTRSPVESRRHMVVTLGTDDRKHPHIQRLPNAAPWITSSNFHRAQDPLSSRTGGKLGEFIGSKAPKIKLCVFKIARAIGARCAFAAGHGLPLGMAQKKKCGRPAFALRGWDVGVGGAPGRHTKQAKQHEAAVDRWWNRSGSTRHSSTGANNTVRPGGANGSCGWTDGTR